MDDIPPPTLEDHFQRLIKGSLNNLFGDVGSVVRDVRDVETKCVRLGRQADEIEERNKKWRENVDVKLDTIISLLGGVSKELQTHKRAGNGEEDVPHDAQGKANVWSNIFNDANETNANEKTKKICHSLPLSLEFSDEEEPLSLEMSPPSTQKRPKY